MNKESARIEKMDVACVQTNKVLSIGVDGRDVERCKRALKEFGALAPPIVGIMPGGGRVVLNGECEFAALREMGAREMDAVAVDIQGEDGGAKIALLLASLKRSPAALCEGMLIQQAMDAGGTTQAQICAIIGKSAAWVSKRLALVTRLDPGVREFVGRQLLDPGSAQEIARLPTDMQYEFANNVVRDSLPKSTVEKLVSGFSVEECPDAVKRQIIEDPQGAAPRFMPKGPGRYIPACLNLQKLRTSGIGDQIAAVDITVSVVASSLNGLWPETATPYAKTLSRLLEDLAGVSGMIQNLVSPGKGKGVRHAD